MNKIDKALMEIKNQTGMEIINKSFDGVPLFDIPYCQPFKFDLQISFNSIRGACSFQLHFPSLYIKANEVKDFSNEVSFISFLIEGLNKDLKKDYSAEWVLQ